MKFLIAFVAGIAAGGALAAGCIYYNPFAADAAEAPLADEKNEQIRLSYSAVADHAIVYTNAGESRRKPHPEKVLQLWEPPIRQTEILTTILRDEKNEPAGIGIKFSSRSEQTRVLSGKALIDSAWYVYLPARGTLLIAQTENYWDYLREIVVPALWDSGHAWKGDWRGTITSGPDESGAARVYGGSGAFEGMETGALETLTARAYSADMGPVAMEGLLTIGIPGPDPVSAGNELAALDAD